VVLSYVIDIDTLIQVYECLLCIEP